MTNLITSASRFCLYGSDNMKKNRVSFTSALWGSTENIVRRMIGLPPVSAQRHTLSNWAVTGVQRQVIGFLGLERSETLPAGFPVDVFECLDRWVQAKGGSMKVGDNLTVPLLKLNRRSAVTLPNMWIAYIDFESEGANFKALQEEQLEDALARECDQQLNIRIMSKPARIEIDNPNPPMVKLIDKWAALRDMPPLNYVLGIESTPSGNYLTTNRLDNASEFSAAFFGASGSGKTQAMMAAVLSVCANTSPEQLTVIIVDPKAIDFVPFAGLSHLKDGRIITDAAEGAQAVFDVLAEMDRRVKAGDPAAAQRRILLAVDELGDLLMSQKNSDELVTAMTRLAQKGRAWGISMFLGSQRAVNESFPRSVQTNMPAMICLRVRNASEAAFASGLPSSDCHKLPGKGAMQVFEPGAEAVRIQGLFVADSNKPTYAKEIGYFIDDIRAKWSNVITETESTTSRIDYNASVEPAGAPPANELRQMIEQAVRTALLDLAPVKPATDEAREPAQPAPPSADDSSIIDSISNVAFYELRDIFDADPDKFSQRKMREVLEGHEGKRRSTANEKALHLALKTLFAE